jgi:hypothetical protein
VTQLTLAGCQPFFSKTSSWKPVPRTLALIQGYFEGYRANDREIYAGRAWIAGQCKVSIRTLARYLRYLRETGWMETVRRLAYTAIRKVCKVLRAVPSAVPSAPYKENPEVRRILRRHDSTPLVLFVSKRSSAAAKKSWFDSVLEGICRDQ